MGQSQFSLRTGAGERIPGLDSRQESAGRQCRIAWRDIAGLFCDPRECLASYLALESAEVIAGVKPANLISVSNQVYPCGQSPYQLWQRFGHEIVRATSLKVHEFTDRRSSVLILLYQPEALHSLLETASVRAILRRAGYTDDMSLHTILDRLTRRINSGAFPHEIGIFLGYPLKDVAGFMGLARIPFTCQGPWKIYGKPEASLHLADTFRWCRNRMAKDLTACSSPFECLEFSEAAGAFFCNANDNNIHLHCKPGPPALAASNQMKEEAAQCRQRKLPAQS